MPYEAPCERGNAGEDCAGISNGTCIDDTGEVALHVRIDEKVVASRGETESACSSPLNKPASITYKVTHTNLSGGAVTLTKTEDKMLGVRAPADPKYAPDFQLFPGDRLEISLATRSAWDSEHHLLAFDRWTNGTSNATAPSVGCPCTDPKSPTCRFASQGASDWFGENPQNPKFPGDPKEFRCVAEFKNVGSCQGPPEKKKAGASTKGAISGAPNCDCTNVDAGLLTGPYQQECASREQQLLKLAAEGKLNLQVGPDGKLASGEFCSSVTMGPSAWPAQGAPAKPPAGVRRYTPCKPEGSSLRIDTREISSRN